MTQKRAKKLRNGVYRVIWKNNGGTSLAAVGRSSDGSPWITPANWLMQEGAPFSKWKEIWRAIDRVELIEASLT